MLLYPTKGLIAAPLIENTPDSNPHFVGRTDQLNQIKKRLSSKGRVTLAGYSGLGKSQIAKEYLHQHRDDYPIIWWFSGNQYLEPQFLNFASLLNRRLKLGLEGELESMSPERRIKTIFYELEHRGLKCLFVFDDVKVVDNIRQYIPQRVDSHLIFTTQNANFSDEIVSINSFERKESQAFLKNVFPAASPEELDSLAIHLHDNPSSLALASEYIRQYPGMTIGDYVQKHKNTLLRMGQRQRYGDPTDAYERDLLMATQLNIEALKNNSRNAYNLLGFFAVSHLSGIRISYVHDWMDLKNIPHQEVVKLLNHMKDYSLVNISGDKVSMHELIQKIVTDLLSDEEKMELIDEAVLLLTNAFSKRSDLVSEEMIKDPTPLLHAERILNIADDMGYQMVEISILRVHVFDVLTCGVRDLDKAEKVAAQLEEDFVSGIMLPEQEQILHNITHSVFSAMNTSNYDEAFFYGKKAQELLDKREDMIEERLRLIANFIQYSSLSGDLDKCPFLVKEGRKLLPKSNSTAYNALFIFATTLYQIDKGEVQEAISLIQDNEAIINQLTLYPSIKFYILNQLAEAFLKSGQFEECLATLDHSEKAALDFYADTNNTFFGNLNTIKAYVLVEQGTDLERAEVVITEALETYEKVIDTGDFHRGQALSNYVYGKLLTAQGKHDHAKKALLKSDRIYEKTLINKCIDDVSSLYTSLSILGMDMIEEELTQVYLNKHIQTFGIDHFRTKEILNSLDGRGMLL